MALFELLLPFSKVLHTKECCQTHAFCLFCPLDLGQSLQLYQSFHKLLGRIGANRTIIWKPSLRWLEMIFDRLVARIELPAIRAIAIVWVGLIVPNFFGAFHIIYTILLMQIFVLPSPPYCIFFISDWPMKIEY